MFTLVITLCACLWGCSKGGGRKELVRKVGVVALYASSDGVATDAFSGAGRRGADHVRVEFSTNGEVHVFSTVTGDRTLSWEEFPGFLDSVLHWKKTMERPVIRVAVFFPPDARYANVVNNLSLIAHRLRSSGREVILDADFCFVDYQ